MGKDLKGRELGVGLAQRKDGRYTARYVATGSKRKQAYFDKLQDARKWLQDELYKDRHETILKPFEYVAESIMDDENPSLTMNDMTVDEWFDFWTKNIVADLRRNTIRNYCDRYRINVQPIIGHMRVQEVRPFHCKKILLDMDDDYSGSTIRQTYITMGVLFKAALMNGLISKHPMDGVKTMTKPKPRSDIKFMSIEEQQKFMAVAKRSRNYSQFAFVLETGLRTGELVGLTWDAVDFDKKTITINKSMEYRYSNGIWEAGPPKTVAGYRTFPLTSKAYSILVELYKARKRRREAPELDTVLKFKDRLTDEIRTLNMKDLVFVNARTGMPTKNSSYDTHLYKLCDEAGIKHFSMHCLRHTYATRAIERGVNPKALQKLLGHGSLQVTMDTYVHVTDEYKALAVRQFENYEGQMA